MNNNVFIPIDRVGWWGGADTRPRCRFEDKVAFETQDDAERSATKIRERGDVTMHAYQGQCGNWHVGHSKT